jgi:hypothetical protein
MIKLEKLLDAAVAQYENGLPIHLSNPKESAITTMSESDFLMMTTKEVQDTLRHTHILISDCAVQCLKFDRDGLRTLCSPRDTIELHGEVSYSFATSVVDFRVQISPS